VLLGVGPGDARLMPNRSPISASVRPAAHSAAISARRAYVIDPTRSRSVAEAILGIDYDGTMIHDG
jgi:hypothetical protein